MKRAKKPNLRKASSGEIVKEFASVEEIHHEIEFGLGLKRVSQAIGEARRL